MSVSMDNAAVVSQAFIYCHKKSVTTRYRPLWFYAPNSTLHWIN